ncbi:MAG: hypothetical protein C0606_13760 [Hyphomicrobiales bacterium]|nr:MAG: hypothetical protein C0606_13760 [Hyphomicrobiales bacterium]
MDDADFLLALGNATLPAAEFSHRAHIRAGYLVLREEESFGLALDRIARMIRAFAAANNADGLYHETITVAFMSLIAAAMAENDPGSWPDFADAHPELFKAGLLEHLYGEEALKSERARQVFLLPGAA